MGEALMSGGAGGSGTIYKWKRYELNSTTRYTWNKWSLSSSTTYRWNKYSADSTTTYTFGRWKVGSGWSARYDPSRSGYVYVGHTWSVSPTSSFVTNHGSSGTSGYLLIHDEGHYGPPFSGRWYYTNTLWESSGGGTSKYICAYAYQLTGVYTSESDDSGTAYNTQYQGYWDREYKYWKTGDMLGTTDTTNKDDYPDGGAKNGYWWELNSESITYSKGSTSYGQVTASWSSAYPSNGASGSYWYESAGSYISYSRGSYIGTVSSSSSSAYPNGSYSGSYWYDGRIEGAEYSQGAAAGTVYNTNRNAYPDNSYTGSYWYVFDGEA